MGRETPESETSAGLGHLTPQDKKFLTDLLQLGIGTILMTLGLSLAGYVAIYKYIPEPMRLLAVSAFLSFGGLGYVQKARKS